MPDPTRRIIIGVTAAAATLIAAIVAVLVIDLHEVDARTRGWRATVARDLTPGASRDAVDKWLSLHRLVSNPGQARITFDKSGEMHRPARYGVQLEEVRRLWPDALSLCTRPVITLTVDFDAADRVTGVGVEATSAACL